MDLAGEQTIPIQNGRTETRHGHRYEDIMRLHEAAPKLIIQERVGDKVKVLSYWPVPELTRAEFALGRLHHALRQNGRPCPWQVLRSWRTKSVLTRFCSARAPICPNRK